MFRQEVMNLIVMIGCISVTVACGSSGSVVDTDTDIDTEPPYNPRIIINDGDPVTHSQHVTLTLSCEDNIGVTMMCLSNAPNREGNLWEKFSDSREWTLSDDYGLKTIYIRFRDAEGNISPFAEASILFSKPTD